jgi:TPR repeat protein
VSDFCNSESNFIGNQTAHYDSLILCNSGSRCHSTGLINNTLSDQQSRTLSNFTASTVYSISALVMNGDHHTSSNEIKIPAQIDLNTQTPNEDVELAEGGFCDLCWSSPDQITWNFVEQSVQILKLNADQGLLAAQNNYGMCLQNGEGVSKDLKAVAHYFKLANVLV